MGRFERVGGRMMDETIRTFDYCIGEASQCETDNGNPPKNHLMLGNGFSIDIFDRIFNYKTLADNVNSPQVTSIFEVLGTSDFEYAQRKILDTLKLIALYPDHKEIIGEIIKDLRALGTELIEVISRSHPLKPDSITDEKYESCRSFLIHFENGNKYTFNYDLLLYWVYMHFFFIEEKKLEHNDGFNRPEGGGPLTWSNNPPKRQNIYYLHGAMHFFKHNEMIHKLAWINKPIKDRVCDFINKNMYPMFISEGTKDNKLSRIYDYSYLKHAFRSLDDIKDNLFIFGHSLGEEDDHVFDQVNKNPYLKNIFISIFDDSKPADKQIIIDKVTEWADLNENKDYYFYNAASANVWGTP